MSTYLIKRGSTYYFRRVIPQPLRPLFGGRREWVESLKTKDRNAAGRLCRLQAVRTDALIVEAESALNEKLPEAAPLRSAVSVPQLASRLANGWRKERDFYAAQDRLSEFEGRLQLALKDHLAAQRGGFPELAAEVSPSSSEAMVLAIRAILTGDGAASLPEIIVADPASSLAGDTINLSRLIERWSVESKPTEKSLQMWCRTCRDFDASSGALPVANITKKHVLAFKDLMLATGSSPATINNRLNQLRSLFRFAMANDLISADPTAGVKVPVSKRAKESRIPYDPIALKALFGGPVHAQGARPKNGALEAAYWLPLLALFTGARLNELGQLRTSDIAQEVMPPDYGGGVVWVIRITADEVEGLKLKSASSARRVPVHAALVELGFLDYLDAVKATGSVKLFPALRPDRFGTVTAACDVPLRISSTRS